MDDEYANFDFPALTEDDLRQIDSYAGASADAGAARVAVEIEHAADAGMKITSTKKAKGKAKQDSSKSPYDRFRARGWLSVTDVVGPTWCVSECLTLLLSIYERNDRCEVQFDYGLRQWRSKPIEQRPKSFKTEKGKEIVVKKEVAERREKIVVSGQVGGRVSLSRRQAPQIL